MFKTILNAKIKHLVFNNLSSFNVRLVDGHSPVVNNKKRLFAHSDYNDIKQFKTSMKGDVLSFNSGIMMSDNQLVLNIEDIETITFNGTYADVSDCCDETNKSKYFVNGSVVNILKINREVFKISSCSGSIKLLNAVINDFYFDLKNTSLSINGYFINKVSSYLSDGSKVLLREGFIHKLDVTLKDSKLKTDDPSGKETFVYNANINLCSKSKVELSVLYYVNYHLNSIGDIMDINGTKKEIILDIEDKGSFKGNYYDYFGLIDMDSESKLTINECFRTCDLVYPTKLGELRDSKSITYECNQAEKRKEQKKITEYLFFKEILGSEYPTDLITPQNRDCFLEILEKSFNGEIELSDEEVYNRDKLNVIFGSKYTKSAVIF